MSISQSIADTLIALEKIPADPSASYDFPASGERLLIPMVSDDHRELFNVDVNRAGRLHLHLKVTHQIRGRDVILVRLDIGGPEHMNPDEVMIPCPHIHIYREGYNDRWAQAPPPELFSDLTNVQTVFRDFMAFCKVVRMPSVNYPLL